MLSKSHTKYIQSLQHKKFRDEHRVFIAEGPKLVRDLLDSRAFQCKEIFALKEWIELNEKSLPQFTNAELNLIEAFELEKISGLSTPHAVLAIFEQSLNQHLVLTKDRITLVLDTIQDPGNLGTIIRIADWFGVHNLVCSESCADCYNPKVVQSSMGSLGRVNIVYTNLEAWLRNNSDIKIFAATLNGKNIKQVSPVREGILIIGNEGKGISEAILSLVQEQISILRIGEAESLNAAVATGILLSHLTEG